MYQNSTTQLVWIDMNFYVNFITSLVAIFALSWFLRAKYDLSWWLLLPTEFYIDDTTLYSRKHKANYFKVYAFLGIVFYVFKEYRSGFYGNKYIIPTFKIWLNENCTGSFKIKKHWFPVMGGGLWLEYCYVCFSRKRDLDNFLLDWGNGE